MSSRARVTRAGPNVFPQRQPRPDAFPSDVAPRTRASDMLVPRAYLTHGAVAPQAVLQFQRTVGNRAARRMLVDAVRRGQEAITPPPTPVGPATVQRAFELCSQADVTHQEDHRALKVEARNIRGRPLFIAANQPSVSPFGWSQLRTAGHTLANSSATSSHYNAVRMHLMNQRE